ncbi:MAG: serine acetyltransferase [Flavobacterium sp.]|nr:serine acetyltransferase [Flavobacterium sp.]
MSKSQQNVFAFIRADFNRYKATGGKSFFKMLLNPGFIGTSLIRLNRSLYYALRPIPLIGTIYAVFNFIHLKFMQITFGFSIPEKVTIGKGIFISHLGTIIINSDVCIGENCNLGPMIVVGWGHSRGEYGVPQIGDRVFIGPGAKIFGPIKIGNDVAIGANAVVNFDVPDRATVVGNPGRILENKGSGILIKY